MKQIFFTLLSLSVLILIGCQTDPTENTPLEVKNIQYSSESSMCEMDIYRSDRANRPAVMFIHGGAWITVVINGNSMDAMGLDRAHMEKFKDFFLENGFHVVNIDYRRINILDPDDISYKDMLDDVKAAISYLKNNAGKYRINTKKIVLFGYSAGAHLAELYSYKVTDSPIPVSLCVSRAGPANFWNEDFRTSSLGGFASYPGLAGLLGLPAGSSQQQIEAAFRLRLMTNLLDIEAEESDSLDDIIADENNKATIDDISPIYHVKSTSPRTILLHGQKDPIVPYSVAVSLDEKLTECGVEHDFITMPNSDHDLNNAADSAKTEEFWQAVKKALSEI